MPLTSRPYYDWFEIQEQLCTNMGIDKAHFRNYQQLVGGGHKDFWYEALNTFVGEEVSNDTAIALWRYDYDPSAYSDDDKWKTKLFDAWNEIFDENSVDGGALLVWFSW